MLNPLGLTTFLTYQNEKQMLERESVLKDATIEAKDRTIAALRGELVARSPGGRNLPMPARAKRCDPPSHDSRRQFARIFFASDAGV